MKSAGGVYSRKHNRAALIDIPFPGEAATAGKLPLRYEKLDTILHIALDMQGSAEGLSLGEIQRNYSGKPLSRRTAERLRDAIARAFPQMEQVNVGELPKRWRIPRGSLSRLMEISAGEFADLATSVKLLKQQNMRDQAQGVEHVVSKIRAAMNSPTMNRIEPDLEALTEAEGLAMRPGPHPKIHGETLSSLRQAILSSRKVRIHYRHRGTGKDGPQIVRPYGFLYGNRHYLIAWSEKKSANDFRSYALANIKHVEILDDTFVKQKRFSLGKFAEQSFGVFQEPPFDVVWQFSPDVALDVREFVFHPSQKLEAQKDGSIIVRFRAGGALEMAWHLFTWGKHVKVLKPKRLKDLLGNLKS